MERRRVEMQPTQVFSLATKRLALARQKNRCGACGTLIYDLGRAGQAKHKFGEISHAHHIRHIKFGGTNTLENCVILCQACHYSAHEGGNYRSGAVVGRTKDFPHFNG
jgi:5-methylcytosine-specific restriction endonuclease McrA